MSLAITLLPDMRLLVALLVVLRVCSSFDVQVCWDPLVTVSAVSAACTTCMTPCARCFFSFLSGDSSNSVGLSACSSDSGTWSQAPPALSLFGCNKEAPTFPPGTAGPTPTQAPTSINCMGNKPIASAVCVNGVWTTLYLYDSLVELY